jgi:LysM repeat protein
LLFVTTVLLLLSLAACELPAPGSQAPPATDTPSVIIAPTLPVFVPSPTPLPVAPVASPTPTPDPALQAPSPTPPPPDPTAAPTQQTTSSGEIIHTVQQGENLFRIGLRYGVSYQELAAYNGIANPNVLSVGQQIRIPPRP